MVSVVSLTIITKTLLFAQPSIVYTVPLKARDNNEVTELFYITESATVTVNGYGAAVSFLVYGGTVNWNASFTDGGKQLIDPDQTPGWKRDFAYYVDSPVKLFFDLAEGTTVQGTVVVYR